MYNIFLQIDSARWCLPSSSGNIKYAGLEQFVLILFFLGIGFFIL